MTPEYLEELAQRADPDELWRQRGLDIMKMDGEPRKQMDTAVALRRYAHHLRDVRRAAAEGKSWLVTALGTNGTAVKMVATPPDHVRLRDARAGAAGTADDSHEAHRAANRTPAHPLYAAGAAASGGWKLVPVEATAEMKRAADDYATATATQPKGMWWWGRVYEAILKAAPADGAGCATGTQSPETAKLR
jgi:hypothetical protein